MPRGLTRLVLLQLLGTGLNILLLLMLPGPIIGLILLFGYLLARGEIGKSVNEAAGSLLRYLPLLLVPAAVGMMTYARKITADFWAIVDVLVLSLALPLLSANWVVQKLIDRQQRCRERS